MNGSPQHIYFNSFIRFDQNAYANPKYNKNDNNLDKNKHLNQSNTDSKNYSNERCYQVRNFFHSFTLYFHS